MIYVNGRFLTQKLTGVQRFASEISSALVKLRDDIIFLVPEDNNISHDIISDFKLEVVKGGRGHFWEQITLPLYLRRANSPFLISFGNTAPLRYKNQIVTHHDISYIRYPKSYSLKFRLLYKMMTPFILNNSKAILTVSDFSKKEIASHYHIPESKINVIYNAVSEIFSPKLSHNNLERDQSNFALAVSSHNYHKNFHGLIDAFMTSEVKTKLKIIGSNALSFNSIDFSKADNEKIEFIGRVSDEELVELYNHAKFFVFPSFYEGFGIPPLEAQACGCPVLSSDQASMPEVLNNSVMYFNPFYKEDIVQSLKRIDDDSDIRKSLAELGLINSSRYSWESSALKVNDLIKYHHAK